jgi:phosphate transport system substrate-binding protein
MSDRPVSRRAVLAGAAGTAASLAGCISTSPRPPGADAATPGSSGGDESTGVLKLGGSSTVYPIANRGGSFWSSNPPPSDEEYWGPSAYGIDTDERLADHFAAKYGIEASGGESPPFTVSVGLSHSGTGLEKVRDGQIDIGNASAPVAAEFPDASTEELDRYTNHVVGVDAQPIIVSAEIFDAGVTELTADQVRGIYRGEITSWTAIDAYDGPEREILAAGGSVGSGTDTAFRANLLGDPSADMSGVDIRRGQNQQVKSTVSRSDNAIAYMALAFVDQDEAPAISLEFEDTTYVPGENLSDPGYPLARDLHCYTWEGTSKKEAAFLHLLISDFGQENFVSHAGYSTLTDERQEEELGKLPDQ